MSTKGRKLVSLPESRARLIFEDYEEETWAVVNRSVPLGLFEDLLGVEEMPFIEQIAMLKRFGDTVLLEWNLKDAEGEIPASAEGMRRVDILFALRLISETLQAIGGVEAPLEPNSTNGVPSKV